MEEAEVVEENEVYTEDANLLLGSWTNRFFKQSSSSLPSTSSLFSGGRLFKQTATT